MSVYVGIDVHRKRSQVAVVIDVATASRTIKRAEDGCVPHRLALPF